jgi:hypothetical protein
VLRIHAAGIRPQAILTGFGGYGSANQSRSLQKRPGDTVSYERAVTAVTVTLDDVNNDGLIGSFGTTSQDNVRDDVEQVFGSAFADKLTGDEKFNSFFGLAVGDPTGDRRRFSGSAWLSVIRR